ncbi:hypothetical protein AYJ54_07900 [Bradyrhizobium centrolobii]|uniref:Uncharacterized protein n=1 Tax=Bradyrhizobium centrolobii TaxID=1505087 RepID=A0A176YX52_9BRAD|nr:hypothetical protein [Bradyrhizobium centrolobii]OAF11774.1 hypothetical protein AYJ54_07900 [Bradyrhizobium centrolobii]
MIISTREIEEHALWQSTWSDDERVLAHTPPGYWYDLVNISMVKRLLQARDMRADLRLRFLEWLNGIVHGNLSLDAMQTVAPACDTAMQMIDEMQHLSIDDKCRLMRKWDIMAGFCNLNPSLIEAMKLFRHPIGVAA